MDEKTKLVVFDKKEVFLLFCLVILASITSFVFGVKVGKNYSFERAGFSESDRKILDLKSKEEEEANEAVKKVEHGEVAQPSTEETLKRLEDEFNQLEQSPAAQTSKPTTALPKAEELKKEVQETTTKDLTPDLTNETTKADSEEKIDASMTKPTGLEGKFTIQLGSYPTIEDARQFAEGFKIRGYNPYIHEAKIDGKGTWYRVTLGVFENAQQARDYIKQEESLFQGQDYRITDLK